MLGYTAKTWDNESGAEPQPSSSTKYWAQLTSCGEDFSMLRFDFYILPYALSQDIYLTHLPAIMLILSVLLYFAGPKTTRPPAAGE